MVIAAEELVVEFCFLGPAEFGDRIGEGGGADGTCPFSLFGVRGFYGGAVSGG